MTKPVFCELEHATGVSVWLNPAHVESVGTDPDDGTVLVSMSSGKFVSIKGDPSEVALMLEMEGLEDA